jgi:hypothetical protein
MELAGPKWADILLGALALADEHKTYIRERYAERCGRLVLSGASRVVLRIHAGRPTHEVIH